MDNTSKEIQPIGTTPESCKKNLFVSYLRNIRQVSKKTIRDYTNALGSRISEYATMYCSDYIDIFSLGFNEAKDVINKLCKDTEFIKHCTPSNKVHITAMNAYSDFMRYYDSIKGQNASTSGTSIEEAEEGEAYKCHTKEYRRSKKLRDSVTKEHEYKCEICGFNFHDFYGSIGDGFIEVHHINPVSENKRKTKKEDLLCVCSNCHSMLHRSSPILRKEELMLMIEIMKDGKKQTYEN